ncbi:MAG: ATP-dependent helicase, partial [Defluviitaleaceae bacterium]|nr:ATP-dependent helicase [Defluviitaleaceae bacterium]
MNENQARAVIHKDGPMMVLAGPGSGKTAVITHRALHLAKGHGVNPAEILVITYSKAAATQMRRRYVEQGGSDSAVFGTFHAVFFRMLRAGGGLPADQVISEEERRTEIKKALASFGYDMEDEFVGSVLNELSLVRNELYDMRHYHAASIGTDDFKALSESYEKFKRENGRFDFDDMLTRCHEMLSSDKDALKKWRARFRYMMIDEFQDINRVQYECVKLLAAPENNLFIVGDDDQSIYRFRGARPEFLLNFRSDYADTAEAVLDLNYRSTDKIIACANGIIEKNRIRYGKKIIGTGRDGPKVAKLIHDDQNAEAAYIAQSIKKRSSKGIGYGETAVIYRINMQARAFVEAFLHANVPFNVRDGAP